MTLRRETSTLLGAFGLVWALAITALRGFVWPNDWAEAQWLVSYDLGFIKRGLPGSVLGLLYSDAGASADIERLIAVASTAILVTFLAAVGWVAVRLARATRFSADGLLVALTFVTSPLIVSTASLNGYYDSLFMLIIMATLLLALRGSAWLAATLLATTVFIHETALLLGLPLLLLAQYLAHREVVPESPSSIRHVLPALRMVLPLMVPGAALAAFLAHQLFFFSNWAEVLNALKEHLAKFDFVENGGGDLLAKNYAMTIRTFFETQSPHFIDRLTDPQCLLLTVPTLFVGLAQAARTLRGERHSRLATLYVAAITLLPLSLHAVAFDTFRLWTYPLFVIFLAAWLLCEYIQASPNDHARITWLGYACFTVVVMNIVLEPPTFEATGVSLSLLGRWLVYAPAILAILLSILPRRSLSYG